MANKFQHKRSIVAGVIPTTGDLANGEIGINLADKKIYTNNGSAIVLLSNGQLSVPGSNTQLAYNNSGSFGASGGLTFDYTSNTLIIANTLSVGSSFATLSNSMNVTTTSSVTIDTYGLATYRSVEYFFSYKDNSANNYQCQKYMIIHDGGSLFTSSYGKLKTNTDIISFSVSANATTVLVNCTSTSSNGVLKLIRQALVV
jgi:hypothetical protein